MNITIRSTVAFLLRLFTLLLDECRLAVRTSLYCINALLYFISYLKSFLFVLESVELALLDHHFRLELTRVCHRVANEHRVSSFNYRRFLMVIQHLTQLLVSNRQ